MNADGIVSTGIGFDGNNMFAYCNNNPVMFVDPNGTFLINAIKRINDEIKKAVSFVTSVIVEVSEILKMSIDLNNMGFADSSWNTAKDCLNTLKKNNIDSAEEKAHFFSQCRVESNLSLLEAGWLSDEDAYNYRVSLPYYPYYGAGYIQLTWESNYRAFSEYIGDPKILTEGPTYVASNYAWSAAGWFWTVNNINSLIGNGASVYDVTLVVNGGSNGLDVRTNYYYQFLEYFGV